MSLAAWIIRVVPGRSWLAVATIVVQFSHGSYLTDTLCHPCIILIRTGTSPTKQRSSYVELLSCDERTFVFKRERGRNVNKRPCGTSHRPVQCLYHRMPLPCLEHGQRHCAQLSQTCSTSFGPLCVRFRRQSQQHEQHLPGDKWLFNAIQLNAIQYHSVLFLE